MQQASEIMKKKSVSKLTLANEKLSQLLLDTVLNYYCPTVQSLILLSVKCPDSSEMITFIQWMHGWGHIFTLESSVQELTDESGFLCFVLTLKMDI